MSLEWMDQARCAEVDPELFMPDRGGDPRRAKAVCNSCEVHDICLDYALNRTVHGIWGGLTERERLRLRRAA